MSEKASAAGAPPQTQLTDDDLRQIEEFFRAGDPKPFDDRVLRLLAEVRLWRRGSAMLTNIGPERRRALLFGHAVTHVGPPPGMKPIKE